MPDEMLTCVECKAQFVYSESEQKRFQQLLDEGKFQTLNKPKRCLKCRAARKRQPPGRGR